MRSLGRIFAVLFFALTAGVALGQGSAPGTLSTKIEPVPAEKSPAQKPALTKSPSPTPKSSAASSPEKTSTEKPKDKKPSSAAPGEQIVTEIYADKAVFDSTKSIGVFTGKVVVTDPRFKIQGDKLTIYMSSKQSEGLDKAVVEGNVGVVRERPGENGAPPDPANRMVGRSDKAVYTAKNGNFELTGNARVQQGLNTHVATSPETVMILNEKGQLQTNGPSRTEIRQAPSPEPTATP
jgi:lipopolysaccharide transport protein LptA